MKTFRGVFIIALCACFVLSSIAFADGYKGDFEKKFYKKACFVLSNAEEIGLSDDQAEKIKMLKHDTKKSVIKQDAEIDLLALDLKMELGKDDPNLNTINSLIDKKYAAKSEKAKTLAQAYVSLKKILTKDQCKKLKDMWKRCSMAGMGDMMQGKSGMKKDMSTMMHGMRKR